MTHEDLSNPNLSCQIYHNTNSEPNSTQKSENQLLENNDHDSSPAQQNHQNPPNFCYNPELDHEIRSRLDKLNGLSDLINSLERQFDEANHLFRETLKQSTERLSSLAKILGKKSIKYGRIYNATRLSLEKSQNECQSACVEFEQATKDHQNARSAIKDAESKLKQICSCNEEVRDDVDHHKSHSIEYLDFEKLQLIERRERVAEDKVEDLNTTLEEKLCPFSDDSILDDAARLNQQLNEAIIKLSEAERKRSDSQKYHLDKANKLMINQNQLIELERNHGQSIKRSKLYFDEAQKFNEQLNSIKSDITHIRDNILTAKQTYASTLKQLEQFSEELHDHSRPQKSNSGSFQVMS